MKLQTVIDKSVKKQLTISDIQHLTFNTCQVIISSEVDMDNLQDIFQQFIKDKAIIILMMNTNNIPKTGHYICFTLLNDVMHYFDSYAMNINNLPFDTLDVLYKLIQLGLSEGYRLNTNTYPLQFFKDKFDESCGRWCILRVMTRYLTNEQFIDLFNRKLILDKPSEFCTLMTILLDMKNNTDKVIQSSSDESSSSNL